MLFNCSLGLFRSLCSENLYYDRFSLAHLPSSSYYLKHSMPAKFVVLFNVIKQVVNSSVFVYDV